jgi:hypothetical protein
MAFNRNPALLILWAGLLMGLSGALWADERRIFENNSDQAWTLKLVPRGQAEVGNMNFKGDGPEVVLGESSPLKTLVLPPHSQFDVEFTHTLGAFYHAFKLTSADGRSAQFTADYPLLVATLKKRPNVALAEAPSDQGDENGRRATLGKDLAINAPLMGDLTILKCAPNAATAVQGFNLFNRTADASWTLAPAMVAELPDKSYKSRGQLLVADAKDVKVDLLELGNRSIPASGKLRFWLAPDADGKFAQAIKVTHPKLGTYILSILNIPGKPAPEDLVILQLKGETTKPWVYYNRFIFDGFLEIENPDQELDFGIEDE